MSIFDPGFSAADFSNMEFAPGEFGASTDWLTTLEQLVGGGVGEPGPGGVSFSLSDVGPGAVDTSTFDILRNLGFTAADFGNTELAPADMLSTLAASGAMPSLWYDNETGRVVDWREAFRIDPQGFTQSIDQFVLKTPLGAPAPPAVPGTTVPPGTPPPRNKIPPSFWDKITADPLKLFGTLLAGGTAAGGLTMALVGMRNASGGLTLPSGKNIPLTPEQQQMLALATQQAQQQGAISTLTLPTLAAAIGQESPALQELFQSAIRTAGQQAGTQEQLTGATRDVLTSATPGLLTGDVTTAAGLTGAAGQGIQNLSDVLRAGALPSPAETIGTTLGAQAAGATADILRRGPGAPLNQLQEATEATARGAEGQVGRFTTGGMLSPFTAGLTDLSNAAIARTKALLSGDVANANPALVRQITEQREALNARLQTELGPGYATSTPGERTLRDFDKWANETIQNDIRSQLTTVAPYALSAPAATQQGEVNLANTYSGLSLPRTNLLASNWLQNLSGVSPLAMSGLTLGQQGQQQRFGQAATTAGFQPAGSQALARIFGLNQAGAVTPSGGVGTLLGANPATVALGSLSAVSPLVQQQQLMEALRQGSMVSGGSRLFGLAASPFFGALSENLFSK